MAYNDLPVVCEDCAHKNKRSDESPCNTCGPQNMKKEKVSESEDEMRPPPWV